MLRVTNGSNPPTLIRVLWIGGVLLEILSNTRYIYIVNSGLPMFEVP